MPSTCVASCGEGQRDRARQARGVERRPRVSHELEQELAPAGGAGVIGQRPLRDGGVRRAGDLHVTLVRPPQAPRPAARVLRRRGRVELRVEHQHRHVALRGAAREGLLITRPARRPRGGVAADAAAAEGVAPAAHQLGGGGRGRLPELARRLRPLNHLGRERREKVGGHRPEHSARRLDQTEARHTRVDGAIAARQHSDHTRVERSVDDARGRRVGEHGGDGVEHSRTLDGRDVADGRTASGHPRAEREAAGLRLDQEGRVVAHAALHDGDHRRVPERAERWGRGRSIVRRGRGGGGDGGPPRRSEARRGRRCPPQGGQARGSPRHAGRATAAPPARTPRSGSPHARRRDDATSLRCAGATVEGRGWEIDDGR